jgi:hypothetical protein
MEVRMLAKYKKIVSVAVMAAFLWMLQVGAMPLHAGAAPAQERKMSASVQEAPGVVEKETQPVVAGKGGSILPYILIGVGVVAVAVVLVFVVFKSGYDITGTWNFDASWLHGDVISCRFSGSKDRGAWVFAGYADPHYQGSYAAVSGNVTLLFDDTPYAVMQGTFAGADRLSGTFDEGNGVKHAWSATRASSAQTMAVAQTSTCLKSRISKNQ